MKRTWKRVGLTAVAGAAAIALWMAFRPRPLLVETTPATTGPMRVTIDEEGLVRVRDHYLVTAPVSGLVSRIPLRQGDSVRAGQLLTHIVPLPMDAREREAAQARVSQAEDAERAAQSRVSNMEAALDQARRARIRAEGLAAQNALAPAEREQAELEETTRQRDLEAARFQQQAAAHEAQAARAALVAGAGARIAIRSPLNGQVLQLIEPSARVVNAGEPLLRLGDCGELEIVTDLLSADAVRVQRGAAILIDGWGGGDTLRGRVRRIEPSAFTRISALGVEEQRVNVIGDLLQAPPALGDGFRVQVHVVLWESDSVLRVPGSALFRNGSGWAVFVADREVARERAVKTGQRNAFDIEILSGLAAGESVILNPSDQVSDGVRIRHR